MDDQIQKKTEAWLEYAQADLDAAEQLLRSPRPNHWTLLLAAFHCQQAVEKILKRIVVARGKEVLKIHDLGKLYSLAEAVLDVERLAFIEQLNQYYVPSRYLDLLYKPLPKLTLEETSILVKLAKEIFVCLKNQT